MTKQTGLKSLKNIFDQPNIYIKNKSFVENKINNFKLKDLQIVADFDSTITQDNGHTSWSIFSKTGAMPEEYKVEREKQFSHYYPYEIDSNISFEQKDGIMKEWWQKHLELFIKYKLNINIIDKIITDKNFMNFRNGMKEFIDYSSQKQIPFIILSAGITNTINNFLDFYETNHPNIHIVSNELKFDKDGFCIGINKDLIIHSENKDEHDMPEKIKKLVKGKKDIIILGDGLGDIKMISEDLRENALKIGFLGKSKIASKDKFIDSFDVVIESNDSCFNVPLDILMNVEKE